MIAGGPACTEAHAQTTIQESVVKSRLAQLMAFKAITFLACIICTSSISDIDDVQTLKLFIVP